MKSKQVLTILMFFFCLNIFGQKTDVASKQQETIQQLQKENNDLQNKLDKMEKEIEVYREDVRSCTSEMNDNMSLWLSMLGNKLTLFSCIITVITALLGGVVPYFINKRNKEEQEKRFSEIEEELSKQIEAQTERAKTELNSQISEAKKQAEIATEKALDAKANQLFAQALNEKDHNIAIELYNQVIDINPKSYNAYNNRGNEQLYLQKYQEAIEDFNMAININPLYANAYNNRGNALMDLQNYQEAIEDYNKAIMINPNLTEAFYNRGNAELYLQNYQEAKKNYTKALEINPNYVYAYVNRGKAQLELQNYQEAIEDYTKAIMINPKLTEAYRNRAECYRKLAAKETDATQKNEYLQKAKENDDKAQKIENLNKS